MAETTVVGRIVNIGATIDELTNLNPLLKKNEICIVEFPSDIEGEESTFQIKVGDGVNYFVDLPYMSAKSDDSKADLTYVDDIVSELNATVEGLLDDSATISTVNYTISATVEGYELVQNGSTIISQSTSYSVQSPTDTGNGTYVITFTGTDDESIIVTVNEDDMSSSLLNSLNNGEKISLIDDSDGVTFKVQPSYSYGGSGSVDYSYVDAKDAELSNRITALENIIAELGQTVVNQID